MKRVSIALLCGALLASPAFAIFAMVPADRIDEVPVDRLLANLERNAQNLSEAHKWRAIGRVHLLAYLRQTTSLPVYRERPGDVAEGSIDECTKLDEQAVGRGNRDDFPVPRPGERCEARSYTLGPDKEAPGNVQDVRPPSNPHLLASIDAYQRARKLEPRELRTRVALAFAYDRALKIHAALNELRFAAREGLKRLPRPRKSGTEQSDWEMHVVLSEAQAHLALIAASSSDRRLARELKRRLDLAPPAIYITPIIVPLTKSDEFSELVDFQSDVAFDFSGQGLMLKAGWVKTNAAWLVWDPKEKQKIVSGFQLFGSVTFVSSWDNGFKALGSLDDNGDNALSGEELKGLSLWRDRNGNGVSEHGEVKPVAAYGIVSLNYDHERVTKDYWVSPSGVTFSDGTTRPTYDWQLKPELSVAWAK